MLKRILPSLALLASSLLAVGSGVPAIATGGTGGSHGSGGSHSSDGSHGSGGSHGSDDSEHSGGSGGSASGCREVKPLKTSTGEQVGTVTTSWVSGTLTVKYQLTKRDFRLCATAVEVSPTLSGIPQTNGNANPSSFRYKASHPEVTEYVYSIPVNMNCGGHPGGGSSGGSHGDDCDRDGHSGSSGGSHDGGGSHGDDRDDKYGSSGRDDKDCRDGKSGGGSRDDKYGSGDKGGKSGGSSRGSDDRGNGGGSVGARTYTGGGSGGSHGGSGGGSSHGGGGGGDSHGGGSYGGGSHGGSDGDDRDCDRDERDSHNGSDRDDDCNHDGDGDSDHDGDHDGDDDSEHDGDDDGDHGGGGSGGSGGSNGGGCSGGSKLYVATYARVCKCTGPPPAPPTLATFAASLPPIVQGMVIYQLPGDPSYLQVIVTGGSWMDGTYQGWCNDAGFGIPEDVTFDCMVGSTYDTPTIANWTKFPGNQDLLNWVLNQDFVGKSSPSGGEYTLGDVQRAIWDLIDNETSGNFVDPYFQEHVDEIVNSARSLGRGFTPVPGQIVGVLLRPTILTTGVYTAQLVCIPVVWIPGQGGNPPGGGGGGDEECEEFDAWAGTCEFPGPDSSRYFKFGCCGDRTGGGGASHSGDDCDRDDDSHHGDDDRDDCDKDHEGDHHGESDRDDCDRDGRDKEHEGDHHGESDRDDCDRNKGGSDKGDSDKGDPDKGDSDKGGSDKGGSDKGGSDKGGSDKGGSDKGGSDKGGSDKGGSGKGGSDKGGSGKGGSDKGGSDKGGSGKGGSDKGGSSKGGSGKGGY